MNKLYPAIFVNIAVIKISTQIVPSLQYDVIVVKKRRRKEEEKNQKIFCYRNGSSFGAFQNCFHQFQGGEVGQTISEAYKLSLHITMFSFFISHFVFKKQPDEVSR